MRKLGYDGSPLPLAEWLQLRQTIESGQSEATSGRINLPPVIVCCALCQKTSERLAHTVRKHLARGLTSFYCSNACWARHQNLQRHGERRCEECSKPAPKAVRRGKDAHPYCSRACLLAARERRKAETRERNTIPCGTCSTLFVKVNSKSRYCSRACANVRHSSYIAGAQNPKWKDGAAQRRQVHGAKGYRIMRPLIVAADGHACVVCAAAPKRLHVHHIDSEPTNNEASNLVTLCPTCHRLWHAAESRGRILWPWLKSYAASRSVSLTSK